MSDPEDRAVRAMRTASKVIAARIKMLDAERIDLFAQKRMIDESVAILTGQPTPGNEEITLTDIKVEQAGRGR